MTNNKKLFNQITIIGLGLIGSSLALSIRKSKISSRTVGYSRSPKTRNASKRLKLVDKVSNKLEDSVRGSDLIIICTPLSSYANIIKKIIPQLITILFVVLIFGFLTINAQTNMDNRGIDFGFGFLSQESSFDVQFSLIEYSGSDSYARAFLVGLLNTLLVSFVSIIFCTIIGVIIGVARLSTNFLIGGPTRRAAIIAIGRLIDHAFKKRSTYSLSIPVFI